LALPEITKTRYTIGEVAKLAGVETHVLRFWERQFPDLKPRRRQSGARVYSPEDVGLVMRIRALLYEDGMTIEGAKKRLAGAKDDDAEAERIAAESARGLVSSLVENLRELRASVLAASYGEPEP
jgi:DNA-binding transcriptional MerR regulator